MPTRAPDDPLPRPQPADATLSDDQLRVQLSWCAARVHGITCDLLRSKFFVTSAYEQALFEISQVEQRTSQLLAELRRRAERASAGSAK